MTRRGAMQLRDREEFFVEITGEPFHLGRLVIFSDRDKFNVDIDLVEKESKKIFHHIGRLYQLEREDAVELAMQKLSHFLNKKT